MAEKKTTTGERRFPIVPVTVDRKERKSGFIVSLQFVGSKEAAVDYFQNLGASHCGGTASAGIGRAEKRGKVVGH